MPAAAAVTGACSSTTFRAALAQALRRRPAWRPRKYGPPSASAAQPTARPNTRPLPAPPAAPARTTVPVRAHEPTVVYPRRAEKPPGRSRPYPVSPRSFSHARPRRRTSATVYRGAPVRCQLGSSGRSRLSRRAVPAAQVITGASGPGSRRARCLAGAVPCARCLCRHQHLPPRPGVEGPAGSPCCSDGHTTMSTPRRPPLDSSRAQLAADGSHSAVAAPGRRRMRRGYFWPSPPYRVDESEPGNRRRRPG